MTQHVHYPTELARVGEDGIAIPGGLFDPGTLPLDLYQRANYPANGTWLGTASAGTSGTHRCNGNANSGGTPVNGKIPFAANPSRAANGETTMDNYITPAAYSGAVLFKPLAAPPDQGGSFPYLNAQVCADHTNALLGVSYSVNGVAVWAYDGAWHQGTQYALPVGTYGALQFYYDLATTRLFSRLNSGLWSSVLVASGFGGFNLNTQLFGFGLTTYVATQFTGDVQEGFLSKIKLSQLNFDDWLHGWVNPTYGLSL